MNQFEWFWDGFINFLDRSAQILPDFGCWQPHLIWTKSILTWKLTCNGFYAVTRGFKTERVAFAIARKNDLATDSSLWRRIPNFLHLLHLVYAIPGVWNNFSYLLVIPGICLKAVIASIRSISCKMLNAGWLAAWLNITRRTISPSSQLHLGPDGGRCLGVTAMECLHLGQWPGHSDGRRKARAVDWRGWWCWSSSPAEGPNH